MSLPTAWREMMQSVEGIEAGVERETGGEPIVVGLSNYFISAEHAFYDPSGEGVVETGGRGLLGYNGWMWDRWQKSRDYAGRNFILVAFESKYQRRDRFEHRFAKISDLEQAVVMKSGRAAGRFFYRIGYGYIPPPDRQIRASKLAGGRRHEIGRPAFSGEQHPGLPLERRVERVEKFQLIAGLHRDRDAVPQ
jgi:hypothetical protein